MLERRNSRLRNIGYVHGISQRTTGGVLNPHISVGHPVIEIIVCNHINNQEEFQIL